MSIVDYTSFCCKFYWLEALECPHTRKLLGTTRAHAQNLLSMPNAPPLTAQSANRVSGDLVWGHDSIITNNPSIPSFIHISPQNLPKIVKINLKTSTALSYVFPLNL